MIVEIPDADDFARASSNLLNLAWQVAVDYLEFWEESELIHPEPGIPFTMTDENGLEIQVTGEEGLPTPEQAAATEKEFWRRSQPALANALSLIQQAVEFALKGRIAAVSPFLLISREAGEYSKAGAMKDLPFSSFRSIDAADLMRLHDTVCQERIRDRFGEFWEHLRRERNRRIHSVEPRPTLLSPFSLIQWVLVANEMLAERKPWFYRRLEYLASSEMKVAYETCATTDYAKTLSQMEKAIHYLDKKFTRRLFGHDHRSRTYVCVNCRDLADEDLWDELDLGKTAQLTPKAPDTKIVLCAVCRYEVDVRREACPEEDCGRTVICDEPGPHFGECLSCGFMLNGPQLRELSAEAVQDFVENPPADS